MAAEQERIVNIDGVDVVVGATRDHGDGSWTWSCRWCAATGPSGSSNAADLKLWEHADELHDADVHIAWREDYPAPVVLDACPQALRGWTAAVLQRYPDSIVFVSLIGPRLTGVGEASTWGIEVDLRPSAPDGLDVQIRDDTDLAAAEPPEGVSLWCERGWSKDRWTRHQAGWQRIAGWPHRGFGIRLVSIQGPEDAYQWNCDLCGARGVAEIGADERQFGSRRHHQTAREPAAQRAHTEQLAHMRETHGWSPDSTL